MNQKITIIENLRRWRYAATVATGGAALLLVGCADDADDEYTAAETQQTEERQRAFTDTETDADRQDYSPAETEQTVTDARQDQDQEAIGQTGQQESTSDQFAQQESQDQQRQQQQTGQEQQTDQQSQQEQSEIAEMAPEGAEVQDSAQMVLKEEELNVGKRQVPAGGVLIRKKIVTDDETETVDLRREDIEVVRLSPEEARERQEQGAQTQFSGEFAEEEIFIPIMQEEAVAQTEVQPREVVRAETETETEEEQVSAQLREEELEVERVGQEGSQQQDQQRQQQGSEQQTGQQTGQQAVQTGQGEQQDASMSQESRDLRTAVRERLQNQMGLTEQQLEQIDIQVDGQTVTLSGSLPDEAERSQIEQEIESIDQVESVENNLE